jgi:lysine-specific permease
MAFFSFGGTEVIGITAGETLNPKTTIPKAIKNTFWRILLFYILSILVMGLVIRNDDPFLLNSEENGDVTRSPFTLVFERAGLSMAAHLMNGVVFSAVISAGNSALFAASRTLMALAEERKAPLIFCKLNRYGVPYYSILATALVGCISFVGIFLGDGTVFLWLISITGVSGILTWVSIALIHVRFRQGLKRQNIDTKTLSYMAPFYPVGPILAFVLGFIIIFGQGVAAYNQEYGMIKILISYFGIPLYFGLYFAYKYIYGTCFVPLEDIDYGI